MVLLGVPLQLVVALPEVTKPLGNVSASGEDRVSAVVPGLLRVMVRVDAPPVPIVAGLKALPSVGGTGAFTMGLTVNVVTAGAALFPSLVCKAPAASELV
jgi:hypothetical protein